MFVKLLMKILSEIKRSSKEDGFLSLKKKVMVQKDLKQDLWLKDLLKNLARTILKPFPQ